MNEVIEAVKEVAGMSLDWDDRHYEALQKAIEALEREDADGCDGCRYMWMESTQMPCLECKRNHKDMWTRITGMTLEDAIAHCEEIADYDCYDEDQRKCAEEHRQLAKWLSELKRYMEEL